MLYASTYQEHSLDIAHKSVTKLTLAGHSHKTTHLICMGEEKLIAKEEHYVKRKVREAIEIVKNSHTLNIDDGWKLSNTWMPILNQLKHINSTI